MAVPIAVKVSGSPVMAVRDLSFNQQLPDNIDAERFVLGAIMSSETGYVQVAGSLLPEDFSLEKHKRIFLRMGDLHERGEKIDRVTLANELMKQGQLQSVDGLSYLVSLDDGLPQLHNLDSYVAIVKEKSLLRRIITVSQDTINRCLATEEDPKQILGAVEDAFMRLSDVQAKNSLSTPAQILTEYDGGINAFLDTSKRIKGITTGFLKFDEMTGGLREGELFILAARPAMGKTALALNIAQHVAGNSKEPESGSDFFARDVERVAAYAHDVRGGASRPATVSRRVFKRGRAPDAAGRDVPDGGIAAVHRRRRRNQPDGCAFQAAEATGRARSRVGGDRLFATDAGARAI